jgi:general secretion pathway protein G
MTTGAVRRYLWLSFDKCLNWETIGFARGWSCWRDECGLKTKNLTPLAGLTHRGKHPVRTATATSLFENGRRARGSGFTLVELLIVIAIILTIAGIAIPNLLTAIEQARTAKAVGDIRTIGYAALEYEAVNEQYPNSLAQIGYGGYRDPWGSPYQYLDFANVNGRGAMRKDRFLVPLNTGFDLYSMGRDGQSVPPLTAAASRDDVIWANDGAFIGPASDF